MEGSIRDLSLYRIESAKENLKLSKQLFEEGQLKFAMNRSYYAIFHALRSVNALDGFDSSKHSGVIAHFNYEYVRTLVFPRNISKMISSAMEIRQKSDYQDFYIVSKNEAEKQIQNAEYIIGLIEEFLKSKF